MNKPYKKSIVAEIKNDFLSSIEKNRMSSEFKTEKQWEELSTGPKCI